MTDQAPAPTGALGAAPAPAVSPREAAEHLEALLADPDWVSSYPWRSWRARARIQHAAGGTLRSRRNRGALAGYNPQIIADAPIDMGALNEAGISPANVMTASANSALPG